MLIVDCALYRQSNKRTLLLLLIAGSKSFAPTKSSSS